MTNEISDLSNNIFDDALEFQIDKSVLYELIEEYMRCIKEQDKDSFLKLFYHSKTPWLGKFDSISEAIAIGNNPDVINDLGIFDISKQTFINSMVTPPGSLKFEETFENPKIDTDGLVASISFEYRMLVNDDPIKGGWEFWQLIKSNVGWKIVSVIHSIKF